MHEVNYVTDKWVYLYRVFHSYGDEEKAIYFHSELSYNELINILGCIDFQFEELVDKSMTMDEASVLRILMTYYGVRPLNDEKVAILKKARKNVSITTIGRVPVVYSLYDDSIQLIDIDRYAAREVCCGPEFKTLMSIYLPKVDSFLEMVKTSTIA